MKKVKGIKLKFFITVMLVCVVSISTNMSYAVTITLSEHSSTSHSKSEIMQRYNSTITYDYSKSEYLVNPNASAPYLAGSLQQGVIDDTIKRINFYRWLVGVNDNIVPYPEKMERNQKGAVILNKLGYITHTPTKPSDMSEEFYKEAYAGCYYGDKYGDLYSGNCSYGPEKMPDVIDGYIDDLYNADTTYGVVGHRLSILDPFATKASFGKSKNYSTLSMYYEATSDDYEKITGLNFDNGYHYYTFPSAGYFPRQLFKTDEYWTVFLYYNYFSDSDIKVTIEYNGKEYQVEWIQEYGVPAISFRLPDELIQKFGGAKKIMPAGIFNIKITGFNFGANINGEVIYSVNFFDKNLILNDFSFKDTNITLEPKSTHKIELLYNPTNAQVDGNILWSSSDIRVAKIDENGNVTAIRPGKTTITAIVENIEKTFVLNVEGDPNFLFGDLNRDGKVNAADATRALEIFKNDNATEEDLMYGDMDGRNGINANDATMILELFKNSNIN